MPINAYYPEMNESPAGHDIRAYRLMGYYAVYSKTPLNIGKRGVRFIREEHGEYAYQLTSAAFDKLEAQFEIDYEMLLD